MKKIVLFILSLSFGLNLVAQNSNLTIFSEDGNPFYVILNGIRQNEQPETNVRVDNLINEYYSIKLIFGDENLPAIERKVLMVVDADANKGEVTYKIKRTKKGELVLRYFSFTPAAKVLPPPASVAVIQYNTKPLPIISFGSNVSTTTSVSTSTTTSTNTNPDNVSAHINIDGMSIGANIQVNDNYSSGSTVSTTTTTTTTNVNAEPNHGFVTEEVCLPMNSSSFFAAKKSIEDKAFSDTKLSQAKTIAEANCLSSMQIKEVCSIFDFEDVKLEFAKFAYDYCYDKNNYWQVNDVFNFESTTEELNSYIKTRN